MDWKLHEAIAFSKPHPEKYGFCIPFIREEDVPFVRVDDLRHQAPVVCIHAQPGTGKTTVAEEFIHQTRDEFRAVIVLTPRMTLAESLYERFHRDEHPFVLYSDPELPRELSLATYPRIVCQVESLHRVSIDEGCGPVLLIIDEVESVLSQLASTFTHGSSHGPPTVAFDSEEGGSDKALRAKYHERALIGAARHLANLGQFTRLLGLACAAGGRSKALLFDAFLSDNTFDVLQAVGCPAVAVFRYLAPSMARSAFRVPACTAWGKEDVDFIRAIREALSVRGERVFVYSSSKAFVERLKAGLQGCLHQGFFESPEYFEATGDHCTGPLGDVDAAWSLCRLVVVTAKVTVGVNFTLRDHFDVVFCYASAYCGNRIRDIFQALFRTRHPRTDRVFFLITERFKRDGSFPSRSASIEAIDGAIVTAPEVQIVYNPSNGGLAVDMPPRHEHLYRVHALFLVAATKPIYPGALGILRTILIRDEEESARSKHHIVESIGAFFLLCNFTWVDYIDTGAAAAHEVTLVVPEAKRPRLNLAPWRRLHCVK